MGSYLFNYFIFLVNCKFWNKIYEFYKTIIRLKYYFIKKINVPTIQITNAIKLLRENAFEDEKCENLYVKEANEK